jgi:AcrB/AcrD/AcrF family
MTTHEGIWIYFWVNWGLKSYRFCSPRLQRQHPHAVWPRTGSRIVVDDAIVVVRSRRHHLEHCLSPREATVKAMEVVSGPVIMIALVLCAVCLCLWLSWAESLGSLSAVCYYRRGGCRLLRNQRAHTKPARPLDWEKRGPSA